MRDTINYRERAEISEMEKKLQHKKERLAVNELLAPYKRGGQTVTYSGALNRYIIHVPKPLQIDGQAKITAATEEEVFHKAYTMLCKPVTTLRDAFYKAMEDRDDDESITDQTQARVLRDWNRYYGSNPIANRPITEIKASEISRFLKGVSAGHKITRSAYNNIKSIVNFIYDYAVNNDIVPNNIARQVRVKGKFKPQDEETYTDESRTIVLRYIEENNKWDDSIYYAAIYLMFHLCVRVGEIKALRWSDYDADAGTIEITREVVTRDGKQTELDHTKSAEYGNRTQYLSQKAIALLEMLKANRTSMLIFPSEHGDYLSTITFNKCLKRISNWTGIPYMSSHKIRFWSVTALCRETNGDIAAVGEYAGQHCRQTTLHYLRKIQGDDKKRSAATAVFGA